MPPNELFDGFNEENYEEETKTRWGSTSQYAESKKKRSHYSADQKKKIKEEGGRIFEQIVGTDESQHDDEDIQAVVGTYHSYLNQYFYTCDREFLKRLADMWITDPRFAKNFEKIRKGGAAFAREAVYRYVEVNA